MTLQTTAALPNLFLAAAGGMFKVEKCPRGLTDRVTALPRSYALDIDLWPWHITLTFNPGGTTWSLPRLPSPHKLKFKHQSVQLQKIDWISGNKRPDRWPNGQTHTLPIALPSRLTRSVNIPPYACYPVMTRVVAYWCSTWKIAYQPCHFRCCWKIRRRNDGYIQKFKIVDVRIADQFHRDKSGNLSDVDQ